MKFALLASASALLIASAAVAQTGAGTSGSMTTDQTMPSGTTSMPTDSGTPQTTPMPGGDTGTTMPTTPPTNPPVGEQPMPGQMGTDPSATGGMQQPMGTPGAAGAAPMGSAAPMTAAPPPAPRTDYPMCSKTVTDSCKQAGEGRSSKAKRRK
ncbi:hypothetical protein [Sphingobium subterraneum]|uniref:Fe-S oxidoreductase n=1 Tax=Sphingobium subterraneum TaxID=627688 RepID=A0A841IYG3_9SPHN|nr:hypothetical protein [Sphingobium subterraneum]MBB6123647.1 hypothetical protein [Sphingobium subterraneum]